MKRAIKKFDFFGAVILRNIGQGVFLNCSAMIGRAKKCKCQSLSPYHHSYLPNAYHLAILCCIVLFTTVTYMIEQMTYLKYPINRTEYLSKEN